MPERSTIRYTYDDYLAIPEDPSRRYEIVDGHRFEISLDEVFRA